MLSPGCAKTCSKWMASEAADSHSWALARLPLPDRKGSWAAGSLLSHCWGVSGCHCPLTVTLFQSTLDSLWGQRGLQGCQWLSQPLLARGSRLAWHHAPCSLNQVPPPKLALEHCSTLAAQGLGAKGNRTDANTLVHRRPARISSCPESTSGTGAHSRQDWVPLRGEVRKWVLEGCWGPLLLPSPCLKLPCSR